MSSPEETKCNPSKDVSNGTDDEDVEDMPSTSAGRNTPKDKKNRCK